MGDSVSIAAIRVEEPLYLLNFAYTFPKMYACLRQADLFRDLSYLFSKPVAVDDDPIEYIPTQYIAEYVKNTGYYDGIVYSSSMLRGRHQLSFLHALFVPNRSKRVMASNSNVRIHLKNA